MTRRANLAMSALCVVGVSAGCDPGHGIIAYLPSQTTQGAVSDDEELCNATTVQFVMDRPDVGGEPTIDVAMESAGTCKWKLPAGVEAQRGVYSMLIRFDTKIKRSTECGPVDTQVTIGAYAKKAISFPFPDTFEGFTDDQFRSRATDTVPNYPNIDFDIDDDARDNLAEVANDNDPCAPAAPVDITITPEATSAEEGAGIPLVIEAAGGEGDAYEVVVTFTHENGAGAGTQEVRFLSRSDSDEIGVVDPAPPANEGWIIDPGSADELPEGHSGRWRIVFAGDEPFVGSVRVVAQARLDAANILDSASTTITVNDVDDPSVIVDEDGAPLERLVFKELRNTSEQGFSETDEQYAERIKLELLALADTRRIRVSDDDVGDDVSTWSARLVAADCPPITSLERDQDAFVFRWAPQNADAVAEAAGSAVTCTIELLDPDDVVQSTAVAELSVAPLQNDASSVTPPTAGALGMPRTTFAEHLVLFEVVDPDEIEAAPSCAVALTPRAGTPCTAAQAFPGADGATCTANGVRSGARWPFAIALHPGADYFTVCGAEPAFDVELAITDVSPDGTDAPITIETCGSEPCIAPFFLRTSNVVEAKTLDLGAGYDGYDDTGPLIDGVRRLALIRSYDTTAAERTLSIADIGADPPVIVARAPAGGQRTFEEWFERRRGAVDEVNGRFITIGRDAGGTLEVVLVDYGDNPAAATWTVYTVGSQCDEPFNDRVGGFVADSAGNLYLTCIGASDNQPPPRLVRFDGTGARTSIPLTGIVHPSTHAYEGWEGEHVDVVQDLTTGNDWLMWPENDGVVAIDLTTVGGTLATEHLDLTIVSPADCDGHTVIAGRGMYLLGYEVDTNGDDFVNDADNDDAVLRAVVVDNGPVLDPRSLALPGMSAADNNGFSRLKFIGRPYDPLTPIDEPDLIIQPGYGDFPLVDLDSFTIVGERLAADVPAYGTLHEGPDRRFAVWPAGCEEPEYGHVLLLYPWDGGPMQTLTFDTNCATNDHPEGGTFSLTGDIGVWIDGDGDAWIFDFVEAAAGQD